MQNIGAFKAKTHLSEILDQAEKGEQFVITKHGRPIAKIIPFSATNLNEVKNTIDSLQEFVKQNKLQLQGLDWKKLRDEGRK